MKPIVSFDEWIQIMESEKQCLLFVKADNCSVCDGLLPQVEALEELYPFPFYRVNITQIPEIAGQLSLFTAPVVLLFNESKEYAKFARFVPMKDLERRMGELMEWRKAID